MSYTPVVNFNTLTLYLGIAGIGQATAASHDLTNFEVGTTYYPGSGGFTSADVGMPIAIVGGGPVDADMPPINFVQGALFHTTIASVVSSTHCTLTDAPDTSIYNTGFATVILYRPCPMASDVATLPSGGLGFQYSSSIAPGTADSLQFTTLNSLGGALGVDNPYVDRFGAPKLGQPVYLVSSDTGDIFGGYIDSLTASSYPGVPGKPYAWSAQCASWMGLAKRRVVPPPVPTTFAATAGDEVFRRIVLNYMPNDGVSVTSSTAPAITLACPVGANVGQLLDQVVSLISTQTTAWYWTADAWRNFILTTRTGTAAPWDVTDGSDLLTGQTPYSQSIVSTHNQMANTVYVIGQNTLINTLNANFVGNGTATVFNTPVDVGAVPTITLNAGAQTVGILGVDTGKDWYWSQGSTAITQDAGGAVLTPSDELLVSYTPEIPAIAQDHNVVGLQQAQAIEATSGEYDYSFSLTQPILPADLLAFATAYQVEYGLPAQTCAFYTLRPGLAAGQLQSITLPDAGISGSFLIATVQMTVMDNVLVWQYTAFGGASIGDYITAWVQFINRQQSTGSIITPTVPITPPAVPVDTHNSAANANITSIAFPNNVTAGDLLICVVSQEAFLPNPTVLSDTLGNTWTQAIYSGGAGIVPYQCSLLWAIANSSGANTVTATVSRALTMIVAEFSGIALVSPLDQVVKAVGATAPSITPTQDGELIISVLDALNVNPATVTPPESLVIFFPAQPSPSSEGLALAFLVQSSAGSFTSSLQQPVPTYSNYISASFKRLPAQAPPAQTINVLANPQGTVTHSTGALTAGDPVLGNGGGDVKIGAAGQLVPAGGSAGQVLAKNSGTDFDTAWATNPSGDVLVNSSSTTCTVQVNGSTLGTVPTIFYVQGVYVA